MTLIWRTWKKSKLNSLHQSNLFFLFSRQSRCRHFREWVIDSLIGQQGQPVGSEPRSPEVVQPQNRGQVQKGQAIKDEGRRGRLLWARGLSANIRQVCAHLSAALEWTRSNFMSYFLFLIAFRASGDVIHELLTLEGNGIQNLLVTDEKIVAQLSIKHKLLTSKVSR